MTELDKLRNQIDHWDQQLVKAFEGRLETVMEILEYKRKAGLPIYDRSREEKVIKRILGKLNKPEFKQETETLFRQIIAISKKIQSKTLFPFNIVLIGFMGTGKTTIGKLLSKGLDMEFVDLDTLIEERLGMKISQYFEKEGEAAFRKVEKAIVEEVSSRANIVISCGGGVVLDQENIANLKKNGKLLLLQAKVETVLERLKEDDTRPLLKAQDLVVKIKDLLDARGSLYIKSADYVFDTDGKKPQDIVDEVIKRLLNH
ncbi:shikimate kinase [Alkaliphilus hydrothermalis]|uniref:Shikimate kinase n=1 Tax=Alkaliphilus hydrothermalis TaxID=1482730 RepID=A0ABS2NLE4_9FIRM|nr:shikimate kinase [Alkaliphilus hydrothermalis]